ncbi:hypothetical protein GCM10007160_37960 [Litchfieldella qijiaojingensis]|uniref:diguanylate cyclase n=1 Tax=Litchfieldella qijiaojingensis TaxID=980347 RepID=A0ABQ2ZA47_9GAMM|nr:diguanylate cyclase [Halomonas qijiaojingensis]GGY06934.1 hypothetical protein GCM10007160_37960 [Halomonas qijiaojingensis]
MTAAISSLRNRFLLALCGVLCLALLALVLIARYQITPILLENEDQYASAELDRAERALASEFDHMRRLVEDWAWWDDSYEFVQGQRPEYVDSNLYDESLETLDLQLMAFFTIDNEPYWISGFDDDGDFTSCRGEGDECNWANDIIALIQGKIDHSDEDTHTWLMTYPLLAMVGMSPIYMSQDEVPPEGWLVMVKPLSEAWLMGLRETSGIDLSLNILEDDAASHADTLERLSLSQMKASRILDAIPPSHVLRLEALLPRQRYQASQETFRFALYWTSGVLIVTLIVVLFLLERMVLGPLRQFAHFTQQLQHHDDNRVTPGGLLSRRDEIGTLMREFQHLREHQQHQQDLLLELSQHDHLTGLANRRLFDERLGQALNEARWKRASVATLMVDVDHFKAYNDHYGHQAGDECLVKLATCMNQCFSAHDQLVARTGGEEFSILLPGMSLYAATERAERLRAAIERLALPHAMSPVAKTVTVSIGVEACSPGRTGGSATPSVLMRATDEVLYAAKQSGRNRVCNRETDSQH